MRPPRAQRAPACGAVRRGFQRVASTLQKTLPGDVFSIAPRTPVDDDIIPAAEALCHVLAGVFHEERDKQERLLKVLATVFKAENLQVIAVPAYSNSRTDGGMLDASARAAMILEVKNEIASSGDAFMQALQYYVQLSHAHHLPSLILTACGPYLAFAAGFWYNGRPQLEPLFPSLHSMLTQWSAGMLAHVLNAARACISTLLATRVTDAIRFASGTLTAPWATTCDSAVGPSAALTYIRPLCTSQHQRRIIFTASSTEMGSSVVRIVKITRSYGYEAHVAASRVGFAPQLCAHRQLPGGWHMVVMEYLSSVADWYCLRDLTEARAVAVDASAVSSSAALPVLTPTACKKLQALLQSKYETFRDAAGGPWVHGDLHQANIMVQMACEPNDDDGSDSGDRWVVKDVRAVDFDWAGRQGIARYEMFMNKYIEWHKEVKPRGLVMAAHDASLIARDVSVTLDVPTRAQTSPQAASHPPAQRADALLQDAESRYITPDDATAV